MAAELFHLLLRASIALGTATVVVLALRRPLRSFAGPRVCYAFWAMIPLALLAAMLPGPAAQHLLQDVRVLAVIPATVDAANLTGADSFPFGWILATWAAGSAICLGVALRREVQFRRSLGTLAVRIDGTLRSAQAGIGPAVIGLLRGSIVLPSDFEQRYSAAQRDLILQHERVHIARGDLGWNLIALGLCSAQWFNPLLRLALHRFRFDQEISADAVVLARRPRARRTYAEAMLRTQLTAAPSPLGCHWQSDHPLKERILMLKQPRPGITRRIGGAFAAVALSLSVAAVAWAMQPASSEPLDEPVTYARLTPPKYPAAALDAKQEGRVELSVQIQADGSAGRVEVHTSSGVAVLDEAALAAVSNWKFNPGKRNGVAVSAWIKVPVAFSLSEPSDASESPAPTPDSLDEIYIRPKA